MKHISRGEIRYRVCQREWNLEEVQARVTRTRGDEARAVGEALPTRRPQTPAAPPGRSLRDREGMESLCSPLGVKANLFDLRMD